MKPVQSMILAPVSYLHNHGYFYKINVRLFINQFYFHTGVAHRGASIRIPRGVSDAGCGYFEDRRPSSNCDPYSVVSRILKTIILEK